MPLHVPPDRSHPASCAGTGSGISCSHPQDPMSRSRLWHRRKPQSLSCLPNTSGSPRCCRTTRRTRPQGSSCSCKPEARYGGVGFQMTGRRNSSCSVCARTDLRRPRRILGARQLLRRSPPKRRYARNPSHPCPNQGPYPHGTSCESRREAAFLRCRPSNSSIRFACVSSLF